MYPWHAALATRLQALISAERVPSALLLSQPPGWGIQQLAAAFAMQLLQRQPLALADLREFAHHDFRLVERAPERTQIVVEQIRRAAEFVVSTAQHGRKVTLVLGAEQMNLAAANALLKTLEEPPAGNVVMLVSEAPERLLPTVRSRCQQFTERAGHTAQAHAWLLEQGLDSADASLGLALSNGAPVLLAGFATGNAPLGPARFVDLLSDLLANPDAHLAAARGLAEGELETVLPWWINVVRLALRCANGAAPSLQDLDERLARAPADQLLQFVSALTEARVALRVNASRPMLTDRLAWQFAGIARLID